MTKETPIIGRKTAIETGAILVGTIAGVLYAPRVLKFLDSLEQKEQTPDDKVDPFKITDTPQLQDAAEPADPTNLPPPQQEKLATQEPTKGWEIPGIEEWKLLLANPKFITEPRGPSRRIIVTPQFDLNQYTRLEEQYRQHFYTAHYRENSCGSAVIATLLKTFTYFKTGDVPDITIADIINGLMKKTHNGYQYIRPNGTQMMDKPLEWALTDYGEESHLFRPVTGLTPDWGLGPSHLIPGSQWRGIFENAQKEVLDKGGVLVARVLKYGIPPILEGHYVIFSSLAGSTKPLIVYSIGPLVKGERQGNAQVINLGSYCENDGDGFLWMMGVVPTG